MVESYKSKKKKKKTNQNKRANVFPPLGTKASLTVIAERHVL
jgi:hypothetical protein